MKDVNSMLERLTKIIDDQDEIGLEKCSSSLFFQKQEIDESLYEKISDLMLVTWHEQHEDLVNLIYLRDLKSNIFIDPIMQIALNKETYRPYDYDLESALRKCVHALVTIDTEESKEALDVLVKMDNENVRYALEMYQ